VTGIKVRLDGPFPCNYIFQLGFDKSGEPRCDWCHFAPRLRSVQTFPTNYVLFVPLERRWQVPKAIGIWCVGRQMVAVAVKPQHNDHLSDRACAQARRRCLQAAHETPDGLTWVALLKGESASNVIISSLGQKSWAYCSLLHMLAARTRRGNCDCLPDRPGPNNLRQHELE
jgi:hypothetical protein